MSECPVCGCPDRRLLKLKEVAQALAYTEGHLVRALKAGQIEGKHGGKIRQWRISHESVHAFLGLAPQNESEEEAA